jgi:hypothetical protein
MSEHDDPPRWLHGASDAPAGFAALARADEAAGPDRERLARMLGGIAVQVGRPELANTARSASAQSSAASSLGGVVPYAAGLGVLALVALGLWTMYGNAPERSGASVRATSTSTGKGTGTGTGTEMKTGVATMPSAVPAAPEVVKPAGSKAAAHGALRSRIETPAARSTGAQSDPVAELALLERAQHVLRSDPSAALALAEQHRAQFARGTLAQEREVLAVEALLRLGRRAAAEKRARAFAQRYPESSHLVRVHDLLRSTP